MSDTAKRDAMLGEFHAPHEPRKTLGLRIEPLVMDSMAEEIIRLRAENTALKFAVERVRAACENELRWIDAQPVLRALEETP